MGMGSTSDVIDNPQILGNVMGNIEVLDIGDLT
jgi:hypothetical protein